jgi:hypothetical protein
MSFQRIAVVAFAALAMTVLTTRAADACTCFRGLTSACEVYENYDIALIGRVVEAGRQGGDAKIRIERAIKGVKAGTVEVMRNQDASSMCGYSFRVGVDYVIFATRNDNGEILIGGCSDAIWEARTPGHADAIRFTELLAGPAPGGWIFGTVEHTEPSFSPFIQPGRAVEGASAQIRGPVDRKVPVVKGRYEFLGLPSGRYTVSVEVPASLPGARSLRGAEHAHPIEDYVLRGEGALQRTVTISHDRACSFSPFSVLVDGRLSGIVVSAEGRPVPGIDVEVAPASIDTRRGEFDAQVKGRTDERGRYEIGPLPEGTYVVGVNLRDVVHGRRPYPRTIVQDPAVRGDGAFALQIGEHRELPALELGSPAIRRRLSGTVFFGDQPLHRARITISESDGTEPRATLGFAGTDGSGRFTVDVVEGRSYVIEADLPDRTREDPVTLEHPIVARGRVRVTIRGDRQDVRMDVAPVRSGPK